MCKQKLRHITVHKKFTKTVFSNIHHALWPMSSEHGMIPYIISGLHMISQTSISKWWVMGVSGRRTVWAQWALRKSQASHCDPLFNLMWLMWGSHWLWTKMPMLGGDVSPAYWCRHDRSQLTKSSCMTLALFQTSELSTHHIFSAFQTSLVLCSLTTISMVGKTRPRQ